MTWYRQLFILIFLVAIAHEALAEHKYWRYRERLITNFVAPGAQKGHSLIASDLRKDSIKFADTTSMQGWYIATLATEYELLKNLGKDYSHTLQELYWAIDAVNRLDDHAEETFGAPAERNGFFIRDDADVELAPRLGVEFVESDYIYAKGGSGVNEMSQDMFVDLLMGFALVKRFINPAIKVNGQSLVEMVQDITLRVMRYIQLDGWIIYNPIVGDRVERGAGARGLSMGFRSAATYVLEREDHSKLAGAHWKSHLIFWWSRWGLVPKFHNRGMILMLAITANVWGGRASQRIARRYDRLYGDKVIFNYLHSALHAQRMGGRRRTRKIKSKAWNIIASAPIEGPSFENSSGWTTWNRFFEPASYKTPRVEDRKNPWQAGSKFAGIDFMLMYNLYTLVHGERPHDYAPTSKYKELLYRFER